MGFGSVDKLDFSDYMKAGEVKENRKKISRLVSLANKRLKRLENAGLDDSPAYQKWVEAGAVKFSVKGKDHNE